MRINLLQELARHGNTFTVDNIAKKTKIPQDVLWVLLSRLEKQGKIERIEKGKYIIIPLGAEKGKYTLDEFVLGTLLVNPCVISYWSALNYYGLTEQIPNTVFIQTTARKKKQKFEIFGVPYKIIRIKPEKIFGNTTFWIEETKIEITDKEKTIIDCLDKPKYAGGIIEVSKALKNKDLNLKKIEKYARKMNNTAVIRRLGYLSDRLQLTIDLDYPKIRKYLEKARNYILLDPTMSKKGDKDPKWQVVINWDEL
jgi:predicted transcriptional regulator of viral defense system